MIHQKKGSRALWAVAFAAAPIGAAHASPIINLPQHSCNSDGQLDRISWQNGSYVGGSKDTVISATVRGLGSGIKGETTDKSSTETVPFDCIETKIGFGAGKTGGSTANVFASAEITKGTSFSIDFGPLYQNQTKGETTDQTKGGLTGSKIDFEPTFTAFDYKTTLGGIGGIKGESQDGQVWVTDFNLDLHAVDTKNGDVLFTDFLGVQVISGASALSGKDLFFFDDGQLVFDPNIDGTTKVNLYSSPLAPPVPEPASLALFAAGLIGMAAVAGRRKQDDSSDGEPEA